MGQDYSQRVPARVRTFAPPETGMARPYFQYEAELSGLAPGTEYFYRVLVDGQVLAAGETLRFRTAGPGPFSYLAFGDSGLNSPEQGRLARLMSGENPALVLHTGDLVYPNASFAGFETNYFAYYRDLMARAPFFPSLGNHDYPADAAAYRAVHALPSEGVPAAGRGKYYSFDWGNVHFVALDTNASLVEAAFGAGDMLEWLQDDLTRSRNFWQVVYFHHAPYATGAHELDPVSALVRARVVPILERNGVPLVLSGHEHNYQRSYPLRNGHPVEDGAGTVYITTGGGGGGLYHVSPRPFLEAQQSAHHYVRAEVDGGRMTIRAIRIDGQEIDRVTLAPPPRLEAAVNAASFTPRMAPGSLISIFGHRLAVEEGRSGEQWPTDLSGTSVTVDGHRIPLLYVSPGQINAQLPYDILGSASLAVASPNGSAEMAVDVSEAAPAIFRAGSGTDSQPAVVHDDGTLVSLARPAQAGERIAVYLTGLGRVSGDIRAGQKAPSSPLLSARVPVEIRFGETVVQPSFAGLAPGYAGLYQVNFQVPREPGAGAREMRVVVNGIASEAIPIAVRSGP